MTDMVWIVTKEHSDDREVIKGVYRYGDAAYQHAADLTAGMGEREAQKVSVMAHPIRERVLPIDPGRQT